MIKKKKLVNDMWKITPTKRAVILRVLDSIENAEPKTVYYYDIFHTGLRINSNDITKKIVRFLKDIV